MRCPSISELPPPPAGSSGWPWTSESHHWWGDDATRTWPSITIVTPSFNTGTFLEATIRSVLLQGYPNLEYIVIDGGSDDNSCEILSKYSKWLSYCVSELDDGQYDGIYKGLIRSSGNILGWLNSDDMLVQDGLSIVGSIFNQFTAKVDWITGLPFFWDILGHRTTLVTTLPHSDILLRNGGHDGRAIQWIMQEGTFWTRALWEKAGASLRTDLRYAGDFELWMRFARFAQLYLVDAPIGGNRRRKGQKTQFVEDYNREIDAILRTSNALWRKQLFLRKQPIRSIIRLYLRYFKRLNRISYDPISLSWQLI